MKIYQGNAAYGMPAQTVQNNKVYQGNAAYGMPVYTVQNNKIYQGNAAYGMPAYTLAFQHKITFSVPYFSVYYVPCARACGC